jgi:tetratricopeptide (TPR) repeat protein
MGLSVGCRSVPPGSGASPKAATAEQDSEPRDNLARAHAHFGAGVIHEMDGDSNAALEEFNKAAMEDPDDEALVLDVSRRFLQSKQPARALDLLLRATAQPHATGLMFARLGLVYNELGQIDRALAASRQAIKKAPHSLAGYQNLCVALIQAGRSQEALTALSEAAAQTGVEADFLLGLADMYQGFALQFPSQKEKVHVAALSILNRAKKLDIRNPTLQLRLADGLNSLGSSQEAVDIYLDLLKKLPDIPLIRERVHGQLAEIYLRGSDGKRAIEQLEAIIREDPTSSQPYFLLGTIALDEKRSEEAIEYLRKAVLLNPTFEQAYLALASAQLDINKTSEALTTLENARRLFSRSFSVEYLTGSVFSRQKAWAEAIQHFAAAEIIGLATEPDRLSHFFYFQFGAACERKGEQADAEKYFKKCLELAPDFDEAQNYLGYMWAERGTRLAEARELIEKAVHAQPTNAAYLDSLGWVLFKLNQPREALPYILKAIEYTTEPDATLLDHLGDIYAALQDKPKAREAWLKSLSVEENEVIRKKMDSGDP